MCGFVWDVYVVGSINELLLHRTTILIPNSYLQIPNSTKK